MVKIVKWRASIDAGLERASPADLLTAPLSTATHLFNVLHGRDSGQVFVKPLTNNVQQHLGQCRGCLIDRVNIANVYAFQNSPSFI
jgi:hypothetical protein